MEMHGKDKSAQKEQGNAYLSLHEIYEITMERAIPQ